LGVLDSGFWIENDAAYHPGRFTFTGGPSMGNDGEWFYASNGQQQGPVAGSVVRQWLAAGQLHPLTLVWTDGMPDWLPAQQVPALAGNMPAPASAPATIYAPAAVAALQSPAQLTPLNYYGVDPRQQVHYGGFWIRLLAYIIDAFAIGIPIFIIFTIMAIGLGIDPFQSRPTTPAAESLHAVKSITNFFVSWLYFAVMESSFWQATLGKKLLGMSVTDQEGNRISFGRATGRYFAKILSAIILLIGFMMAGWTQRKQALHDMIAGTYVVRKPA
jgi:uncharacterized RDD family membrane protein YckC